MTFMKYPILCPHKPSLIDNNSTRGDDAFRGSIRYLGLSDTDEVKYRKFNARLPHSIWYSFTYIQTTGSVSLLMDDSFVPEDIISSLISAPLLTLILRYRFPYFRLSIFTSCRFPLREISYRGCRVSWAMMAELARWGIPWVGVSFLMSEVTLSRGLRQLMCVRREICFACRVLPITCVSKVLGFRDSDEDKYSNAHLSH